ncbi:Ig-like domain-containing protein [Bacillus sp. SJS]|uniref:Ig-like domain-containing protein n=1 Tax=Bacillus sp. SJS TaxID=1423321 RepID=UPI000690C428|nr:Ig-like domain-containing protein [Bacillus sp. SJS]KZZ85057.1 hypothetical protein AS29_008395 [Bacillus sp. SJS]
MSKKNTVKLGLAAAVAASSLVAANPAQAAAASNAETLVKKAEAAVAKLKPFYMISKAEQVTVSAEFTKAYNEATAAVKAAQAVKPTGAWATKLAAAEQNRIKAARIIDAVKVGTDLEKKVEVLKTALKSNKIEDATVTAYNAVSDAVRAVERSAGKVYGPEARKAVQAKYVLPGKLAKESVIYEVSQYLLHKEIDKLITDGKLAEVPAQLEVLKTLEANAVTIKEAGNKNFPGKYPANTEINAALQENKKVILAKYDKAMTPAVTGVSAINLKQVEVTFNKDLDTTLAETVANYELKDSSGNAITVSSADLEGKKVVLTLAAARAQSTSAKLTVKNVKDAKGVLVAETTNDVKFVDIKSPEVSSIEVVAPKVVRVSFSEPLATVPTFKLNNGATSIVNTAFTPGNDYVDLTIGVTPENGSKHTLNINGGTDFATFKVEDVNKEFTYTADTVAPTASVEVLSATQVKVKFSEDVVNLNDSNVKFYHTAKAAGYELIKGTVSGKEIILNLQPGQKLPEGAVKILVDYVADNGTQVQDAFGNKFAEAELAGTFTADKTAPVITGVEGKTSTTIDVTFDESVVGASTPSNYTLKDSAGDTVAIQGVALVDASKNIYRITTTNQLNGGSYNLTVKGIEDASGNKLAEVTKAVALADTVRPTLATTPVQLLSSKKVQINFSEAMDKASIENKANYLFGTGTDALDSKVKLTATNSNKSVVLDFTDVTTGVQTTPAGANIQVLRVADAAGNLILAPTTTVTAPSTATAPLFDKAEVTGKNTVKLYFKEVITNAEADDFLVTVGTNPATAAVNLSNEVIDGKSVITLTTATGVNGDISSDLTATPVEISTAASATVSAVNSFGTKVSLSAVTGADVKDKFAPSITNAVFTDDATAANDDALVLTFSENLYAASVQESDFTVAGRSVKAVQVTNNTVTLTLSSDSSNTSVLPATVAVVGSIEDLARNAKTSQTFELVTPAAPSVTIGKGAAAGTTALTGSTTAMEYSVNGGSYTTFTSANQAIATNIGDSIKVRTKQTGSANKGATTTLNVTAADIKEAAAPTGAISAANDDITGLTAGTVYEVETSTGVWTSFTADTNGKILASVHGKNFAVNETAKIRVKATTTKPASAEQIITAS